LPKEEKKRSEQDAEENNDPDFHSPESNRKSPSHQPLPFPVSPETRSVSNLSEPLPFCESFCVYGSREGGTGWFSGLCFGSFCRIYNIVRNGKPDHN
jgi:hypothetical protein